MKHICGVLKLLSAWMRSCSTPRVPSMLHLPGAMPARPPSSRRRYRYTVDDMAGDLETFSVLRLLVRWRGRGRMAHNHDHVLGWATRTPTHTRSWRRQCHGHASGRRRAGVMVTPHSWTKDAGGEGGKEEGHDDDKAVSMRAAGLTLTSYSWKDERGSLVRQCAHFPLRFARWSRRLVKHPGRVWRIGVGIVGETMAGWQRQRRAGISVHGLMVTFFFFFFLLSWQHHVTSPLQSPKGRFNSRRPMREQVSC
jgi:hypothetical protein